MMTEPAMTSPSASHAPWMIARLVIGCILLGVGLGVGIYGGVTFAGTFAYPLSAPYQSGQFSQHLQKGRNLVYAAPLTTVHLTPTDLTVSAPSGAPVPVSTFSGDETQTRSGTTYNAYAQFHAPSAGVYHFALAASGPPRIIVAPTLLDAAKTLIGPAIETVAGAFVAFIGATVLLRVFTRRWWRLQDRRALWAYGTRGPPTESWTPLPPGQPSNLGQPFNPGQPSNLGQPFNRVPTQPAAPPNAALRPAPPQPAQPQPEAQRQPEAQPWYPPTVAAPSEPTSPPQPGGLT